MRLVVAIAIGVTIGAGIAVLVASHPANAAGGTDEGGSR